MPWLEIGTKDGNTMDDGRMQTRFRGGEQSTAIQTTKEIDYND